MKEDASVLAKCPRVDNTHSVIYELIPHLSKIAFVSISTRLTEFLKQLFSDPHIFLERLTVASGIAIALEICFLTIRKG